MSYILYKIMLVAIAVIPTALVYFFVLSKFKLGSILFTIWSVICLITATIIFLTGLSNVAVVYEIDTPDEHKSIVVFDDYYNYTDSTSHVQAMQVEKGNKYVYNKSSEEAVFYPVAYGALKTNDDEIVLIAPKTVEMIDKSGVDYYFGDIPESIQVDSKKSGEIRYCLGWLKDCLEEEQ